MNIKNITLFKILEILWYFIKPAFFTNMTFIITMTLIFFNQINTLPYTLTLNLYILLIGSFIGIFYVRNAINVAVKHLNIIGLYIPKFSLFHYIMMLIVILIHVIMTIILKYYILKKFTKNQLLETENYIIRNRNFITLICIKIVLLYFLTGLYKIYGLDNIGITILFSLSIIIMYLCTYLNKYIFLT